MLSQQKPEEKPQSLSANKQAFMDLPFKQSEYVAARNLPTLINHYSKKHNIKIIMNGTTAVGKELSKQTQEPLQKDLDNIENSEFKYAEFFLLHWHAKGKFSEDPYPIGSMYSSDFWRIYDDLLPHLKPSFLDHEGWMLKGLDHSQKEELNTVISKLECKEFIDERIANTFERQKRKIDDICLDRYQAIAEMKFIQSKLPTDKLVGYIFTNNTKYSSQHFEVFILSQSQIYKPVWWNAEDYLCISVNELPQMPVAWVKPLVIENHSAEGKLPKAQTQNKECGTLGILYLKELLRDNAKQFKEFSLSVPYYDYLGNLQYLFLPSPQVLRYSQSSVFNKVLKTSLDQTDEYIELTHKRDKYILRTLQDLLKATIKHPKASPIVIKQAEELLSKLPKFRVAWLEEFEKMEKKRVLMEGTPIAMDQKKPIHNMYLMYKTHHLHKLAEPENKEEETKPAP